ncbi:hypothetical protein [Marinobacter sp.]|uniref:hypothetical protein n=1 Tax=Marinobacter sp. TaxID=50741 RepID=UPI000C4EA58C|nr:hypothetical protein [Marinobacter sp.]MBE93839.1 hypothetical protein [Marinobacter sp.]MBP54643.1 hypothetical protein [Marinobacter sp.]|tara:strand:- start:300 stop:899 length:600 start_codon:yes stop_codon:yes gene_type:complete
MKYVVLASFSLLVLVGCASQKAIDRTDPIDNALKACGLGYSSEAGLIFRAAYQYAEKEGGADFEAKMNEGLETQIVSLSKSQNFNEGMSSKDKVDLIKSTQNCVVTFSETYRPNTRSELVRECIADLQERVSGIGSRRQVITAKNWSVRTEHPLYEDENPVVYVELDSHSTHNRISSGLVHCKSNNYKYEDVEPLQDQG